MSIDQTDKNSENVCDGCNEEETKSVQNAKLLK